MSKLPIVLAAATAFGFSLPPTAVEAQAPALKMTLFGQPSVNNDSIWMAMEKGFYQQEGLDITYRLFPSGTTAFQAFQTGQGDIVMTGDLPSVQYFFRVKGDYRTIAVIERDAKGYVAVAQKSISKPQDLIGKTIATRVGSTGAPRGSMRRRDRRLLHLAAGRLAHPRDLSGQGALSH
jgi:NitT/TauT family transport system substrate-binding protein